VTSPKPWRPPCVRAVGHARRGRVLALPGVERTWNELFGHRCRAACRIQPRLWRGGSVRRGPAPWSPLRERAWRFPSDDLWRERPSHPSDTRLWWRCWKPFPLPLFWNPLDPESVLGHVLGLDITEPGRPANGDTMPRLFRKRVTSEWPAVLLRSSMHRQLVVAINSARVGAGTP